MSDKSVFPLTAFPSVAFPINFSLRLFSLTLCAIANFLGPL